MLIWLGWIVWVYVLQEYTKSLDCNMSVCVCVCSQQLAYQIIIDDDTHPTNNANLFVIIEFFGNYLIYDM